MIDIKLIRENPELVKENMKKKFRKDLKIVDNVKKLDEDWRKLKQEEEDMRAERNKISKKISEGKKEGKDVENLMKRAKEIPDKIDESTEKRKIMELEIIKLRSSIPNIMSKNVIIGENDSKNVAEKYFGEKKKFNFEIKSHSEIIENLGLADFDSSRRVSGTGFYYLQGDIALLNQALIRLGIETMVKKGFLYVETPLMLNEEIIDQVTDLNDKQNQIYIIEGEKKALIGTSEHSLIGRYVDQEINEKDLPIKHTSYSMCFRKEIGAHGIDEKGIFRTHQFNKIEMIVICKPEESEKFFQELQNITVEVFEKLKIPGRVLKICSGDMGDLKYEQIDVEAWSPRKQGYIEVGSCSNLTTAQAQKLNITTRIKGERITPHTLNNTCIATSRALVALIENYQNKDGSITIPEVLRPFMFGKEKIEGLKKKN